MEAPINFYESEVRKSYSKGLIKEEEVPFVKIPTIEEVDFDGNYEFVTKG